MGIVDILYWAGGTIIAVLIAWGSLVIAITPADFKIARRCFCWTALIFIGIGIMWGVTTNQPLLTRLLIVGAIGAIAVVGFSETLRWVNKREGYLVLAQQTETQPTKPEATQAKPTAPQGSTGIKLNNVHDSRIESNTITGYDTAIDIENSTGGVVKDNKIDLPAKNLPAKKKENKSKND